MLYEDDIPGATLSEPLESHNIAALKWWLICHGIKAKSCCRKKDIIERIREAITSGAEVIDVDGSSKTAAAAFGKYWLVY